METKNERIFAFIIEDEVFHLLTMPDDPDFAGVIAGMQSRPLIMDVTHKPEILRGGFWNYIDGDVVKKETPVVEDPDDYEVE